MWVLSYIFRENVSTTKKAPWKRGDHGASRGRCEHSNQDRGTLILMSMGFIMLEGFGPPCPMLIIVGNDGGQVTKPVTFKIKNLRYAGGFVLTHQGLSQREVGHILGLLDVGEGPVALGVWQPTYRKADSERDVIRRNHPLSLSLSARTLVRLRAVQCSRFLRCQ